jgi:hypothetical protein
MALVVGGCLELGGIPGCIGDVAGCVRGWLGMALIVPAVAMTSAAQLPQPNQSG